MSIRPMLGLAVIAIALCAITIFVFLLHPGSPRTNNPQALLYLLGLFIGLVIGMLAMLLETLRFQEVIKHSSDSDTVRLPFSGRSITKNEFEKMWGDDNPNEFHPG